MSLLRELYFSDRAETADQPTNQPPELSVSTSEPTLDDSEQLSPNVSEWQQRCKANNPDCQFKRYGDIAPNSPYASMYLAYGLTGGTYNYFGMANDDTSVDLDPTPIEAGTLSSVMPQFDGEYAGGEEEETLLTAMDYHCKGMMK